MIEYLNYEFIQRAFLASLLVGITCGILSVFVTLRKMALIGDALSHAVLPGVVISYYFFGYNHLALFLGAVIAGLITSFLITFIQRNSLIKDDSSVGIVFTAMFSIGIIGISWLSKKEGVHLDMKDFLFGNVLGVNNQDLWLNGIIGLFVVISIIAFFKYFFVSTFDPTIADTMGISTTLIHYFLMFLLSLTIISSLQSVGVILVVSMLIFPASTAYLLTNKLSVMVVLSAIIGALSAIVGMLLAIVTNSTPGPLICIAGTFLFILALFLAPEKGILKKYIHDLVKKLNVKIEDISKFLLVKQSNNSQGVTFWEIKEKLNLSYLELLLLLKWLEIKKMIKKELNMYFLTKRAEKKAMRILRSHRLWETFMSKKLNVPENRLHESAEKMEHITEEQFWDTIAADLGNPETDPHGSPIPKIESQNKDILRLSEALVNKEYSIYTEQQNTLFLWNMGLLPNSSIFVLEKNINKITIRNCNRNLEIPFQIAHEIFVKEL